MDSRQRMIQSAALLLRRDGYTGTGFRDVIEHSGAPRGSIYHHFPDGKAQLAAEAVDLAADFSTHVIEKAAREGGPVAAVRKFVEFWKVTLTAGDYRDGCPVVAVAVEAEAPAEAAARAFTRWEDALAAGFRDQGVTPARARRLATMTIAAVEGAIVLCRAQRDIEPLERVGRELEDLIGSAVA